MARSKVILVDSDVISHFIATGHINDLTGILSPHHLCIVENVYKEASHHPNDPLRKSKLDQWLKKSNVNIVPFPYQNVCIKMEYYRLKKMQPLHNDGEYACMSMARFGSEALASSNFSDKKEYCEAYGIEYIGTFDILYIAIRKGFYTADEANKIIADAKQINSARFPMDTIDGYTPGRELSEFIGA